MKKINTSVGKTVIALIFVVLAGCSTKSQINSRQVSDDAVQVSAGKKDKGVASLTNSCAACHGADGVSDNDQWPNLAGQNLDYLMLQLTEFRDGKRQSPIMPATLLAGLSDEQLRDIAQYYSELPPSAGKQLSEISSLPGAHVRARCISCHAMSGTPVTSLWPSLGGQNAGYLAKQLRDYKSGQRPHPLMQVIADELSEKQIVDVAEYYSQL